MIAVQAETADDRDAVRSLVARAFPTSDEADLVDQLRADGAVVYSLLATRDGAVVSHVLFSRVSAPFRALGLAPVSTAASHRRQGIAALLIEDGLARARRDGWAAVFVLGHPAFYGRFGSDAATAKGFASPCAGEHFMVLILGETLPTLAGEVAHAPAFAALGQGRSQWRRGGSGS